LGAVKYGDYNGSACGGGDLFMGWATAVPPQGITCAAPGAACRTSANCCNGAFCQGGACSPSGAACTANGQACANNNNALCCSGNCLGGTCQLGIGLYASSTAVAVPLTCDVANSTPDITFTTPDAVDTTITPPAGGSSGYGQPNCPGQYMVGIDLTQAAFQGKDVAVVGTWSSTLAPTPCDYQATMNVYVTTDNVTWTFLAACTGSSTYYPAGQPQYASASQTTSSTNGTTTTTTTTTATFQAYEEPMSEPAPAPPVEEPAPPPPPAPAGDPRCSPEDSIEMCVSLGVILDIGDILATAENRSCHKASKLINRYADSHARQIDTFLSLERTESRRRLKQWERRHQVEASEAINRALDLASRCNDDRTDRALRRVGFHGLDNH
jgi:hypothetical protein